MQIMLRMTFDLPNFDQFYAFGYLRKLTNSFLRVLT